MRKLWHISLGLAAIGALLGAFRLSRGSAPAHVPAAAEREPTAVRAALPRAEGTAERAAATHANAAIVAGDPVLAAHSVIEGMSEAEPEVDLEWEERLSTKPASVVNFFQRPSVTFAEWARAYREDICACTSFECVTALQDDFVSRAPPFTDMRHDDETGAEVRAAVACANRHVPAAPGTASHATDTAAARLDP